MLWVKKERAMWLESVMGWETRFAHKARWTRRTRGCKHKPAQEVHCGCQSEYSQLGCCKKKKNGRKIFLDLLILLCFTDWDPKELAEHTNFPISLKGDVYQCVVESPWRVKVRNLGAQNSLLHYSLCPATSELACFFWKKQGTKKK